MTNRASEQQQLPVAESLPMNERLGQPISGNGNGFSSLAARRQRRRADSLRLEQDKDKIDGLESERRPSVAGAEHTKLNHQRHDYDHHQRGPQQQQQQQQQQQLALMLQKSDQQSLQNDRASARSGDCSGEDSQGQRPPAPTSNAAQSSNDGPGRALALTLTGSENHWQNSKHPERARYDMNDCYVVGGQGHDRHQASNCRLHEEKEEEGEEEEEEQEEEEEEEEEDVRAHLESKNRRRSIKPELVDDERGGGPTPTNDLIRTLLERDRHAFGLLTQPVVCTTNPGLDQHHYARRRRSSQVYNNEIELRSDGAHHEESDDDESNLDKSGRQGASLQAHERDETTTTSAKTANSFGTCALGSLYYQALRTSASSPSNLSATTPTPGELGRGCDGVCCSGAGRQYHASLSGQQQQQQQTQKQRLASASMNEANSRLLLASFLRSKQEQHGTESHRKQKEQQEPRQQQQQQQVRCREHNKTANRQGKRHSLINLLTHTGHRTQARRSFAAFGMGVLNSNSNSNSNNNNNNTSGPHKTGRRLTSGGELLSTHLGLRNQEPPQHPMQGSAQSLDAGPSAQQQPQYDPLIPESGFKIVVMGTSGSGKTSIIQRFLYGTFSARHLPTVEDTYFIEFPYKKNLINISVSDTSGTYQFPAMRKLAINSGDAFILVYSVDDPQSFDCLEQLRQTILEEREQAYLESVVAACPSDSSSSSTSSLAPPAHHQAAVAGPAAAASGGAVQGPATMMSSLTSTVMNHDKHQAHQRAEHHNHHHHHHHNQLQPAPGAHDLSPARHWSLASLFNHHHHHHAQQQQQQQPREQSGNTNQQFHHHSSIGSSICSSSSCSSADNSRRSSISAAEAALRTRRTRKPPMVIVANKHDLPKDKHLINSDEIEALAVIDWNNGFVRASAALNWNIEEIFQQVLTQARQPPTLSEAIVSKRRKSLPPKLPHT